MGSHRVSGTARVIAAATVLASRDAAFRSLVAPGAAELCERFLSGSRADRLLLASVKCRAGRLLWKAVESHTNPGVLAHWMLRKRRIERLVREAAAEGFGRLIVLGAGLDTLAHRLAAEGRFARIVVVDRAGMQDRVRAALSRGPGGGRRAAFVSGDLVEDGLNRLLAGSPTADHSLPTVVVAEGLLMYLPEPHVRTLLRSIAQLPCSRVRLVATFMDSPPGQPIGFRAQSTFVDRWLRRRGEVMQSSIVSEALPELLQDAGLAHRVTVTGAVLVREWNAAAKPLEGENIFVADRG